MIAAFLTDVVIPVGVGIVTAVGLVAVLIVRFRSSSLEELREALRTAKYEIDIANQRAERLEAALAADKQQLDELRDRVMALESENAILRGAIASGQELAPEFGEALIKALGDHEERSTARMEQLLLDFEKRVRERHRRFVELLPPEQGQALHRSLVEEEE